MAWNVEVTAATSDQAVSWNSETWIASGIEVKNLTGLGGFLDFPMGESDPWLAYILAETPLDRAVEIYEHHIDLEASPQVNDAVLIFVGLMDEAVINDRRARVSLIERSEATVFPPPTTTDVHTHLLTPGRTIEVGRDRLTVRRLSAKRGRFLRG